MKKEIGREFWTGCSPKGNGVALPSDDGHFRGTLSGRVALDYIASQLVQNGLMSVGLPSYCCHTMIEPFVSHGFKVFFYDVWTSAYGIRRYISDIDACDVFLLLDYFGHVDEETMLISRELKSKGKVIIYDRTHTVFSGVSGDFCDYEFGSYRKWMDVNFGYACSHQRPFVDGSGWRQHNDYVGMRQRLFELKAQYMNDNDVKKDAFLPLVDEAESLLSKSYRHWLPDQRSKDVLKSTDVEKICAIRRRNAKVLMDGLHDISGLRLLFPSFNEKDTPLLVPVLVAGGKRDALRRHLIQRQIYCPVHWPLSGLHRISEKAKRIYGEELSLVCDQRYDVDDMHRMVDAIRAFFC